jgi:hypothetical protein
VVAEPVYSCRTTFALSSLIAQQCQTRDEVGGDLAERTLLKGWVEDNFSNENWHGTLKRRLVADNTIFHFAGPKFLGKSLEFTPPTMYIDEKYWMYSFFVMMEIGTTFSNIAGITRSDIT